MIQKTEVVSFEEVRLVNCENKLSVRSHNLKNFQ